MDPHDATRIPARRDAQGWFALSVRTRGSGKHTVGGRPPAHAATAAGTLILDLQLQNDEKVPACRTSSKSVPFSQPELIHPVFTYSKLKFWCNW